MQERAAKIKLLILDIDGVLTDGLLYYGDQGEVMKAFHACDGLGIRLLLEHGVEIAIITGRTSKIVETRAKELGIPHVYQGCLNKLIALESLLATLKIDLSEVAFMGDDIIDLPILSRVGLAAAPKNAQVAIQDYVHFTSRFKGGRGAVRELCDLILQAQGKWPAILDATLKRGQLFNEAKIAC